MTDKASAGAIPVAAGAMPAQTPPADPAPAPATGADEQLGDGGTRALQTERDARKSAERELRKRDDTIAAMELAGKTESEKLIAQAKKDGAAEVTARWFMQVRRSEVKAALAGAGINASVLDLALGAPEFAALKVTDEGEVEGLSEAIAAFKKARADLFKPTAAPGSADGGAHGSPALPTNMNDLIRAAARG